LKEELDMKTVKDILKDKKRDVVTIPPKAKVFDALKIMGEKELGSLMVIDNKGKVCGIISERDYARKVILKGKTSRDTLVEEIMTPSDKMFTVKPDTTVEDCMVLITGKRIRHLPVFDGDKFVGLISIGDVVKSMLIARDSMIEHLSDYISGKYV
jgi:CBS domain-containing protein